jgi:hypothetical protein
MGYSLSWAALKGGNLQTACTALGLRATGKREEIAKSKIVGAQLPTGWYLVMFNRTRLRIGLSRSCPNRARSFAVSSRIT